MTKFCLILVFFNPSVDPEVSPGKALCQPGRVLRATHSIGLPGLFPLLPAPCSML